jgi:hypothetical protein
VHGDPRKLVALPLALTRVKAGADLQALVRRRTDDRFCTSDTARWPIEACEEAIAGCVEFSSGKASQLPSHGGAMRGENFAPSAIAERGRPFGRADDVRKENRGQHTLRHRLGQRSAQEALYLVGNVVADEGSVVTAPDTDCIRIGNGRRNCVCLLFDFACISP